MKEALRALFKQRRAALSQERRQEAGTALLKHTLPYHHILSFASLPEEVNLSQLNEKLAREGRLLLPRIEGNHLTPYKVETLEHTLPNRFGILEPNPTLCVKPINIDAILVPALAFDQNNHRLGYGKGFYDRLLASYPNIPHIGIAFKELITSELPHEPHDIAVTTIYLL